MTNINAINILSGSQIELEKFYINNGLYRTVYPNQAIQIYSEEERKLLIPPKVDEWNQTDQDKIFRQTKGSMVLPIADYYGCGDTYNDLNYFILSSKRCYNGEVMRPHTELYVNYFENYYDYDHELLTIYANMKYMMDYEKSYTKERFFRELDRYILKSPTILSKIRMMNDDNFILSTTTYKNTANPALQYDNKHCKILMEISLLMNIIIPLLTHFIYVNNIKDPNEFLLEVFDGLLHRYDVDIYNKLYETAISIISKSADHDDVGLWNQQDIRSKNKTTHSMESVLNIILNIIPKYCYNEKIVFLNLSSLKMMIEYQITSIGYEYDFINLSSSRRDEENVSEFDKFESFLVKRNESLYLQNKVNAEYTMHNLELTYGYFSDQEIDFVKKSLGENEIFNSFQKVLVFNLFYKYFGIPESSKAINNIDYIKLMLIGRKILESNNMIMLPYIITSKVERLVFRSNINKKEFIKLTSSTLYDKIVNKYRNEKIINYIFSIIATILCSTFRIIDYNDPNLHGKEIPVQTMVDAVCHEVLVYVDLI